MACGPMSVSVAVLTPDDTREIKFGLTRSCNSDGSAVWTIDFTLSQKRNGTMQPRVTVHIQVAEAKTAKAEALAAKPALTPAKLSLLENQIADRAAAVPPKKAATDEQLRNLLQRLI